MSILNDFLAPISVQWTGAFIVIDSMLERIKQLEQADHIEEFFEESDESPPYLPSIKPSAPPQEGHQVAPLPVEKPV